MREATTFKMPRRRKNTSFTWASWVSNKILTDLELWTLSSETSGPPKHTKVVETHTPALWGSLLTPDMPLWEAWAMPAKGKYLLNDQELKNEALYRKFSCISQYQPLVLLLGLSMLACGILLILFFALHLVSLLCCLCFPQCTENIWRCNSTCALDCWCM